MSRGNHIMKAALGQFYSFLGDLEYQRWGCDDSRIATATWTDQTGV